ncbi:MAG: hypothetical protein JXN59_07400 [Anaerolineae bacterium]|nr:hypothetical protein [Anaerolineae bacterium]
MPAYDYPDVLGAITNGKRLEMESVQVATGVYPGVTMHGQPFEILVLLQSKVDKPQDVALAVQLPLRDSKGRRLSFLLPRKQLKITLKPGEVGVVHLPVIAQPPTPPAQDYPLIISLRVKVASGAESLRDAGSGRPPSALNISPFRLEVFRQVAFCADGRPGELRCRFSVMSGQLPPGTFEPAPKYETLWTLRDFEQEREHLERSKAAAERLAFDFTSHSVFYEVEERTREVFAEAGMPLHPAEAIFIAKAITYVFDDAHQYEPDYDMAQSRWFRWLCSLLMQDSVIGQRAPGDLAARELYFAALYDAVWVSLPMVEIALQEVYGTPEEHRQYAEEVVQAIHGRSLDLGHIYLPLVMAGVLLNIRVNARGENLWTNLDLLQEAMRGRARLYAGRNNPVMVGLEKLVQDARDLLRRTRVPRE